MGAAARVSRTPDGRMSLVEHLYELRGRLGKSLIAIAVGIVVVFFLWEPLFTFLRQPYCRTGAGARSCDLYALGIFDQFKVRLRVASIGGVVAAAPVWLYQLGAFITPALHRKEKRYAAGFLGSSLVLFAVGAFFAYITLDKGLDFLLGVGGHGITVLPSISSYLNFVTLTLLAFGVAFEFPVVILFLHVAGVLPVSRLVAWRRGMIVFLAVFAAVVTPSTDPYSFLFMWVPLCLLYEVCIAVARLRERGRRRDGEQGGHEQLGDDETLYVDNTPTKL